MSSVVRLKWLDDASTPYKNHGTTFGIPWPLGRHDPKTVRFSCRGENGLGIPLQTWNTAYWPDRSIKWTGNAIPAEGNVAGGEYFVHATASPNPAPPAETSILTISTEPDSITVHTGKINVSFAKSGTSVVKSISTTDGNVVGRDGDLILLSQSSIPDREADSNCRVNYHEFRDRADEILVEQSGPIRAVITVKGRHHEKRDPKSHTPWLPFVLRFYFSAGSELIRLVHTFVMDGNENPYFVTGIGVRFQVPLSDEPIWNRHVRFSGADDGIFAESPQGLTGLWKDPGEAVLSQLSADGFNFRKRTKVGQSWVKIPSGSRAGGLAYLGGANKGGLAIGLKDFWERYPTQLDVCNAGLETGEITTWLYSPDAEPMDLRQYHDGFETPHDVARTNELFIFASNQTPSAENLASLTRCMRNPPLLVPEPEYIYWTKVFGTYWCPKQLSSSQAEEDIDKKLEFLFQFYKSQASQRKWYGFWDYGDIMHTYDADRHTWRYDVGGYAWDNSELSPDLWLWLYFLRTGRSDVYRMAEALTRHTGEVDVYHLGKYKGLGTRHGVQHWSDSCKQARVSIAMYRRFFYYLSGGDERTGDLLRETLSVEKTFLILDPYRKVRKDKESHVSDPHTAIISLGTDWCAFASAWLIEWERRGANWEESKTKLLATMQGIGLLTNGFVTGKASYNLRNGEISPTPQDARNQGIVQVSHLSAMFGLFEVCAELLDLFHDTLPHGFKNAWLEYCRYFNGSAIDQIERYGASFGKLQLHQGHSRLTAYAAKELKDTGLAIRAWEEFNNSDGYGDGSPWRTDIVDGSRTLVAVEEAEWISTNITALYCLAAIQNLALVGENIDN